MNDFRFVRLSGEAIGEIVTDLGGLRIAVFREFPYLYNGSLEYEADYLELYLQSERSFVFGIYHKGVLIGATTCIPLADETPDVQQPFLEAGIAIEPIMYFGESLLLPDYRGLGFGHRFFDEREHYTRSLGTFTTTAFCSVLRPADHPLRPAAYRPNDAFWIKRGYERSPELVCTMEWQDVNEDTATEKELEFWMKRRIIN